MLLFLKYRNELRKSEQVVQKAEDVGKKWCWKDWVILVQFVVIACDVSPLNKDGQS
jgi:hypothetical protein